MNIKPKLLYVIAVLLVMLISCSSEKTADVGDVDPPAPGSGEISEGPPIEGVGPMSLELTPPEASKTTTFTLRARGFRLGDEKVRWTVNEYLVENESGRQYRPVDAQKGDNIQAKVVVGGREIESNIVQLRNAPPAISKVKIMPEVFKPGDTLSVDVEATDADGDEVTVTYVWTKNGQPAGEGPKIAVPVKRGDSVSVSITPHDKELYGDAVVLQREIRNLPPMLTEDSEIRFDGSLCTYQLKATDPDGDPLTYSLKEAPPGMSVDPKTGLVTWKVPQDFTGKATFTGCASDGSGGEVVRQFTIEIKETQKKP